MTKFISKNSLKFLNGGNNYFDNKLSFNQSETIIKKIDFDFIIKLIKINIVV